MSDDAIDFDRLRDPFPSKDVEWRIGRAGEKNGKVWATCLAYLTARAIMDRLDEVAGPANWRNEYREAPAGGVLCGISIRVGGEWVTKWDGAENTDIEGVKGGLSGSMKRAAVHWGVGRYLYHLPEGFANVHDGGQNYAKASGKGFKWDPPALPEWALPSARAYARTMQDLEAAITRLEEADADKGSKARAHLHDQREAIEASEEKAQKLLTHITEATPAGAST